MKDPKKIVYHSPLPDDLRAFARKLRQEQTDAEQLMWYLVRNRRLAGCKFRRPYPLEPYVLDFFCFEKKLAVELDGGQHNEPSHREYDDKRTRFIGGKGIHVIRFWNHDVLSDPEVVLQVIWDALHDAELRSAAHGPAPSPPAPLPEGEGRKT